MLYYGMVLAAAALFSAQFLANQRFQAYCGDDKKSTFLFSAYSGAGMFLLMMLLSGGRLAFSGFSAALAAVKAVTGLLYVYCSLKVFGQANLSVYSVFAMLGGMLLPFLYGVLGGEPLSAGKAACCILVAAALAVTVRGGKSGKKAVFYYAAVFVLNGLSGVLAAVHTAGAAAVDSTGFMAWSSLLQMLFSLLLLAVTPGASLKIPGKAGLSVAGYALCCGMGNLMLLVALSHLPASVQYPFVTGGVLFFSTAVSVLRREKTGPRELLAAGLGLGAAILIAV